MSVVAIHQTSKPHELAREINKLTDGIARDERLAGEHLLTLKGTKPLGITWEHYLRDCGVKISARHADRLIAGFQGPTRKPPVKPTPPSDIVSEPVVDIVEDPSEIGYAALSQEWDKADKAARQEFVSDNFDELKPFLKMGLKEEAEYLESHRRSLREERAELDKDRAELNRKLEEYGKTEIGELVNQNDELRRKLEARKGPCQCGWERTDGGRRAAGYGGRSGDCGARAASIATGKPYAEVFEALKAAHASYSKRHPNSLVARQRRRTPPIENGCSPEVMRHYMQSIGWQYTAPKEPLYLRADMLPKGGLVVLISRHWVAVIDGVIHDTYDSGGAGKRPVEGYWSAA